MGKKILFFTGIFLCSLFYQTFGKPPLQNERFSQTKKGDLIAWVIFKDKGNVNPALFKASDLLSIKALERRKLRRPNKPLIEFSDWPVYQPYVDQIKELSRKIRVVSRWLNAVSVEVSPENLEKINRLNFVLKVDPVWRSYRLDPKDLEIHFEEFKPRAVGEVDTFFYGRSFTQLDLINVPFLHEKGLHGEGITICLLDDGFNLLNYHIAFDSLNILATYDFINDDEDVTDSEFKAYEGWHGTMTLSTIAGYVPKRLIGPAYKAQYLLAKTEVDQSETPIEEDYWVAGLEWAERNGADIVSSSLGYIDWYTPQDMDGETAKTTIAADMAVEKGVMVFNSAGNEGDNLDHNTLIAPADGKKVLAVAAVDQFGLRAYFSSVGPTADGRIKPDIAAMGRSVYAASKDYVDRFVYVSGTSFSCPLAAGGAALLLQAYPQTTPELMTKALKETASQANFPDKYLGWGVIDLERAYFYLDTAKTVYPALTGEHLAIYPSKPNPARYFTKIPFQVAYPSLVEVRIFNVQGQKILSLGTKFRKAQRVHYEYLDTRNLASGMYIYWVLARELGTGRILRKSGKIVVLH